MNTHPCPLCLVHIPLNDYAIHLLNEHMDIMTTLLAFQLGPDSNALFAYIYALLGNNVDNMSYEELLELCETIGYHKVGISDIHTIASIQLNPNPEEVCPICLDAWNDRPVYQTHRCRHEFCQSCLETWIQDHKTCPLCQQELESK